MTTALAQAPRTVSVTRALSSTTRAAIYEHLRAAASDVTVRDIAAAFDLHPNVARTHLELLADAGLVGVGRRKLPAGGRPPKVYRLRDDVDLELAAHAGAGAPQVLVRLLARLLDPPAAGQDPDLACRAHGVATAEGRRLASSAGVRPGAASLPDAADQAVRALGPHVPGVRVVKRGEGWIDVAGLAATTVELEDVRPELRDPFERGLLAGAFAAAGAAVQVAPAGTAPGLGPVLRVRATGAVGSRSPVLPAATVDARGGDLQTGVVHALRAVTALAPGEVLEVLAEGPGAPAVFARWADRAGHVLLGVERATDGAGRPAIRLLIRKGA